MPGLICKILDSTEFWSAIVGAIVGGLIALGAQMLALRAGRKRREEDHKREQQALAASLLEEKALAAIGPKDKYVMCFFFHAVPLISYQGRDVRIRSVRSALV